MHEDERKRNAQVRDVVDLVDWIRKDTDLRSDSRRRQRKVARDHHEPDTCTSTDPHRLGRVIPRRIDERDESDKDDGRVESNQDVFEHRGVRERLLGDERGRDDLLGEEEDALALTRERDLRRCDRGDRSFVEGAGGTVEAEKVRTAAEEDVGGAFNEEEVVGLVEGIGRGEGSDGRAGGGLDELERELVLRPYRVSNRIVQTRGSNMNLPCC